jgi:sn1-specific diacylglycerol lipase
MLHSLEILSASHDQVIGDEHLLPRFWVITDYSREQVVLVLRGTMSLNEIAADLTCEPEWFQPAETPSPAEQEEADIHHGMPGSLMFPSMASSHSRSQGHGHSKRRAASVDSAPRYHVHGGMLRMAKLMGGIGKPVQLAVQKALHYNPDFGLSILARTSSRFANNKLQSLFYVATVSVPE